MYLIFLILAVIQIPTDWLNQSSKVTQYLHNPETNFQDASLATIASQFDALHRDLKIKLNYKELDGSLPSPFSYNLVDQFFIKEAKGKELFNLLIKLKEWHQLLPENEEARKLFVELFDEDLKQGLLNGNAENWVEWRWQHVPATFALSLMEEIRLRLKLLSGLDGTKENGLKKKNLSLSSSFNEMVAGEETDFLINGDSFITVEITVNNKHVNDYLLSENHLKFRPGSAGLYLISIQGKNSRKEIQINVKPRAVYNPPQKNIRIGYINLPMEQSVDTDLKGLSLFCNSDPNASITSDYSKIKFCPRKTGWCKINILRNGGLFLSDSFLIKELPEPIINIVEAGNNRISIDRLRRIQKLSLKGYHPSFPEGTFKITSFGARLAGNKPIELKSEKDGIEINPELLVGKTHLILHDINFQAGNGKYQYSNSIIIQLL